MRRGTRRVREGRRALGRNALLRAGLGLGLASGLGACRPRVEPGAEPTPEPPASGGEALPYADIQALQQALKLPPTVLRGRTEVSGSRLHLWIPGDQQDAAARRYLDDVLDEDIEPIPGERELLQVEVTPAPCVGPIPEAEAWVLFEGPSSVALALTVPPRVVAWDSSRHCLVVWSLPPLPQVPEHAPLLGTAVVDADFLSENEPGTRQASLSVELSAQVAGPERVQMILEEPNLALRVFSAKGRELARWVDRNEVCESQRVELQVHPVERSVLLQLVHECRLDTQSDHYGELVYRDQTLVWEPQTQALWLAHEQNDGEEGGWGPYSESTEEWAREQWLWPVSAGWIERRDLGKSSSRTVFDCEEGAEASDLDDLPEGERGPCCLRNFQSYEGTVEWNIVPPRTEGESWPWLRPEETMSESMDNSGCEPWVQEAIARGQVRAEGEWLWLPPDPIERTVDDAEKLCWGQELVGVPRLRLPTPEELPILHGLGAVAEGTYWVRPASRHSDDFPDPQGMDPSSGSLAAVKQARTLCVAPHGEP